MARTATIARPSTLSVVTPQPTPALERLVDDYLSACRALGLSPKTVTFSYGYPLRDVFLPWCAREGIIEPAQLTSRPLDRFTSELLEKGGKDGALSKQSVITYTRTVNLFLRWATKEADVTAGVKAQQPKRRRSWWTSSAAARSTSWRTRPTTSATSSSCAWWPTRACASAS